MTNHDTEALEQMTLTPGSVSCDLCGGRLSWPDDRQLSMVVDAMTDHYATNHASVG